MNKTNYDDTIIIHSIRPENIYSQIKAFIENQIKFLPRENKEKLIRSQLFLIVSDNERERAHFVYEKELKKINSYLSKTSLHDKIKIDYWSYKKQKEFFRKLFSDFSQFRKAKQLLKDYKSNKFGGIRGVQNKGILIADYVTRHNNKNLIYHKLDDDIYPYITSKKDENIFCTQMYDIFEHKAKLLKKKNIGILGSVYLIDTSSPLLDLIEGVEDLSRIAEEISRNRKEKKIYTFPTFPKKIYDESGLITKTNLFMVRKVSSRRIINLLNLLIKGNNRFRLKTLDSLNKKFPYKSDTIPGGFISFKKNESISPFFTGGNQDILFSVNESSKNGRVYADSPVGHIKSISHREKLIKSLELEKNYGTKINDFHTTTNIIKLLERNGQIKKNQIKNFTQWRFHKIKPEKSMEHINKILTITKKSNETNLEKEIRKFALKLKKEMKKMSESFNYTVSNNKESESIAKEIYGIWNESKTDFLNIRQAISKIK